MDAYFEQINKGLILDQTKFYLINFFLALIIQFIFTDFEDFTYPAGCTLS
jgi:hypothetical protein